MNTLEWSIALVVVGSLWVVALYLMFVDHPEDPYEDNFDLSEDVDPLGDEIARRIAARARAETREGIRRNR